MKKEILRSNFKDVKKINSGIAWTFFSSRVTGMKLRIVTLFVFLLMIAVPSKAQNKELDNIFSKFAGKNGITTVNISKDMINLASQMDSVAAKTKNLLEKITGVRIMSFEKASKEDKEAFDELAKSIPVSDYKPLMEVNEKDQNVRILLKENGDMVTEFLLVVTGSDDPVLISITGNIERKELNNLSEMVKANGLKQLAGFNKK